jgi:hypothetical protein
MNKWQKMFCGFGIVATILLSLFPPQIIPPDSVRFMFITQEYTTDWLRYFLWLCVILLITGLGIAINKEEHK